MAKLSASEYQKIAILIATSALFSGSFVAGKYTTTDLGPLTTSLLRYAIALLFLSVFLIRYKFSVLQIDRRDIVRFLLLGLFGVVGYHYFFFSSLRHTAVANTAIINATNPILTGFLAAIFIRERLTLKNYLGVIMSCLGVLVLLTQGDIKNLIHLDLNIGDLLMLFAVLSWIMYALIIKQLFRKYSGFTITYYSAVFGVLLLLGLAITEHPVQQIQAVSTASLLSILYMGIGASGLGYFLYNLSIKEIGPTKTAGFVYGCVPIFVAILAFLFFRQPITMPILMSSALVILGLRLMLESSQQTQFSDRVKSS
ncbi:MAG: DMT family transporter [Elainellaceae cyanobacterium]